MKVHYFDSVEDMPFFKAVVTIGTFDGVHLGHRKILKRLKAEAARIGGESVLITFHPHPRNVLRPESNPIDLINTIQEKIDLLRALELDHLVIVPFTPAFSRLTASQYVEDFIIKKFKPHTLIIGYDHHFGSERKGNYTLLESYSSKGAFELLEIEAALLEESSISSTRIREALHRGKVEEAATLLGYPFYFTANVVEGQHLGRTIGFPTANLQIEEADKIIPANGVYAVTACIIDGSAEPPSRKFQPGMMNIGFRPTVNGTRRTMEVHLFDFNQVLYGKRIEVQLHFHLRDEQKFATLQLLQSQLVADAQRSRELLGKAI